MILTYEQMKYLEVDGEETYRFTGKREATKEEKEQLREIDESFLELNGRHLITNYSDLN